MPKRNSWTQSYDEVFDLLMELAMESENVLHMDEYLPKHVRRESLTERTQDGGLLHLSATRITAAEGR